MYLVTKKGVPIGYLGTRKGEQQRIRVVKRDLLYIIWSLKKDLDT